MAKLGWDLWAVGESENGGGIYFYSQGAENVSMAITNLSSQGSQYTWVFISY